jgi:hypothetical protein
MKYFVLTMAGLAMTVGASAATVSEACQGANSAAGSAVITPVTLSCNQFAALPVGDTVESIQILGVDSFDGGNFSNSTNAIDVEYSNVIGDITGLPGGGVPNGCTPGAGGGNSCTDIISGVLSGNSGNSPYDFGNAITTDLGAYTGVGTFDVATVTSMIDSGSGPNPITTNGDVTAQLFAVMTYSTVAPEPGSMLLLGGGLLAGGLIGRKKLVRK